MGEGEELGGVEGGGNRGRSRRRRGWGKWGKNDWLLLKLGKFTLCIFVGMRKRTDDRFYIFKPPHFILNSTFQ